jgi:hypothetical protein
MEVMQKMIGQMREGEGKPSMKKMMSMCMGMCSQMLTAIRETNALAVHATPELQSAFVDWLSAIEEKALAAMKESEKDAAALGAAIGVSEESARYVLTRLAASGKIALVGRSKS